MAPPEPLPYVPPLPQVWSPISKNTVPERDSDATASSCRRTRWAAVKRSLLSAFFFPFSAVRVLSTKLPCPPAKPTSHSPCALKSMALAEEAALKTRPAARRRVRHFFMKSTSYGTGPNGCPCFFRKTFQERLIPSLGSGNEKVYENMKKIKFITLIIY